MAWTLFKSKQAHEFRRHVAVEVETGGDLDNDGSGRAYAEAKIPVDLNGVVQRTRTAMRYRSVTPDDDTDLDLIDGEYPRAFYVGAGGDLHLRGEDDHDEVIPNIPDGYTLQAGAKRVLAANTTASNIVALY